MLSATPELAEFLNTTTQGISIPVLTFTLADGTVLRWARWQENQTFGGVTWSAHGQGGRPLISRYRARTPLGLAEIGVCEILLECGETAVLGGKRLTLAAADGVFRDATVLLERLYKATPAGAVVGKLFRFQGTIISAPSDSHSVSLSVESPTARLKSTVLPKTILSPACGNALFDTACGLSRAAHTSNLTVQAGSSRSAVVLSGGPFADGHFDLGAAVFAGTVNDRRGIRATSGSTITLIYPLASIPPEGTPVAVTTGCDHTAGPRGCARYDNLVRFRGAPHLPKEA